MNTKTFFIKSILLLLTLLSFSVYATDIQVKVDRTQIELNETFTLIFETSETPDDDPDFSALDKDFQVLGTSTSSNMSIINGNYTRSKKWNVTLMALHEGTVTIPSISFGSDHSPSYQINIKTPQKSTGKAGEAFISELNISSRSAYPQQQIIVTQRLLSSSNINAYEFSPLKINGVEITRESLGEVKQYQTKRGDTPYLVLEKSYAIYPQSSGQLTIEPSIASARVAIQGNRSAYDPFRSNTKTIRRSSSQKVINVKAIPKSFKGKHWLAATDVQLVEEFPESQNFKAGEPITRTLLLMADGQNSSQLPEFMTREVKGLKQYPDKPVLKNNTSDTGISGVQQIKIAIIPSAAGKYTLPEISIPWWNTKSNKLQFAKIPARTFNVGAASGTTAKPAISPAAMPPALNTKNNVSAENTTLPVMSDTPVITSSTQPDNSQLHSILLWKIIAFLLATGLLITLFLLWQKSATPVPAHTTTVINTRSLKQALNNIKRACDNNDAAGAKNALLDWASALFTDHPPRSLGDLSARVNSDLADALQSLNSSLYRNDSEQWKCNTLHTLCLAFSEHINVDKKHAVKSAHAENLESLYK